MYNLFVSDPNARDPAGSELRDFILFSVSIIFTRPRIELTADPIELAKLLKGHPQTIFYI
jgi:hypothetical protein